MEKDQMTFVQRYNAKIKHKEDLNDLQTPAGIIMKCTPRRLGGEASPEGVYDKDDQKRIKEESKSGNEGNPSGRAKKRTTFPLDTDEQE